jgi:hypothetical protein
MRQSIREATVVNWLHYIGENRKVPEGKTKMGFGEVTRSTIESAR